MFFISFGLYTSIIEIIEQAVVVVGRQGKEGSGILLPGVSHFRGVNKRFWFLFLFWFFFVVFRFFEARCRLADCKNGREVENRGKKAGGRAINRNVKK